MITNQINEVSVWADQLEDEGQDVSLLRLLCIYNYISLFFGYNYGFDFEYHTDECEGSPCSCDYLECRSCGMEYNDDDGHGSGLFRSGDSGDGSEYTWISDGQDMSHHYGYSEEWNCNLPFDQPYYDSYTS